MSISRQELLIHTIAGLLKDCLSVAVGASSPIPGAGALLAGRLHADGIVQLEARRKRLEDIRLELARPFEHEGRLTDLLVKQRELLRQLDLDKDEAGSMKIDAEETLQAA